MNLLQTERDKKQKYLELVENKHYKEAEQTWHRLNQGTYLGDGVYGANDGIVTTFAVIAGAMGALLAPGVIIILGIANLLADGFSMAASNFLSLRSKKEFDRKQKEKEEWEIDNFPEIEKEEVRMILRRWGIPEESIETSLEEIVKDKKRWVDFMMREELELEEPSKKGIAGHALCTFIAFVIAGTIPLLPYLLSFPSSSQFLISAILTAISFFFVGVARTLVTGGNLIKSGLEVFFIGGCAAGVAYGVGWLVKSIFNVVI